MDDIDTLTPPPSFYPIPEQVSSAVAWLAWIEDARRVHWALGGDALAEIDSALISGEHPLDVEDAVVFNALCRIPVTERTTRVLTLLRLGVERAMQHMLTTDTSPCESYVRTRNDKPAPASRVFIPAPLAK